MSNIVVMLHGAFCGGWVFNSYCKFFEAHGYDCHAPDLPFHGARWASEHAAELGRSSLSDYFEDIKVYLKKFEDPPIVFGHSMGGLLAQQLAAENLISGGVLLAPSPPWGVVPASANEFASAQGLLWLMGDYWNGILKPEFEIAVAQALYLLPKEQQIETFSQFSPESGLATFEIMHSLFDLRRASSVKAHNVSVPLLFVAGEKDRVNHPGTVQRSARRYRNTVDYVEASGHGHWLLGEPGWESIADACLKWLRSQSLG